MIVTTLVLGIVIIGAAGACLWIRAHPQGEGILLFRCGACGQKLRCQASKAGRAGMCPRCRQRWTLPALTGLSAALEACDGYCVRVGERQTPRMDRRAASRVFMN
jgi:DNA-directed RNA polymerase subunit RPC12/RpoP